MEILKTFSIRVTMKISAPPMIIFAVIITSLYFVPVFAQEMPAITAEERLYPNMEYRLANIYWDSMSEMAENNSYPAGIESDRIRVILEMASDTAPVPNDLGIDIELSYGYLVQATVPIENLGLVASDENVNIVRLPSMPILDDTNAVSNSHSRGTISQGVSIINSEALNHAGYTGTGVNVAIIDSGFDVRNPEIAQRIAGPVSGLEVRGNHGTAVAEIVLDVAPDASLYLYDGLLSVVGFLHLVDRILDLENTDVISMSQTWTNSQKPTIGKMMEQKIDETRERGILWVNSVGNYAERHWQGKFVDARGDGRHDFSPNDQWLDIEVGAGDTLIVDLTWWEHPDANFDLYLYSQDNTELESSKNIQPYYSPSESIEYYSPSDATVRITINSKSNLNNVDLSLFSTHVLEHSVPDSSFGLPADARGSLTVGATRNGNLEAYSSRGPTHDGRIKPDIVAPTCVITSSIGTFCGTSSSAPYASGAAALLVQKYPDATADQIHLLLEATVHDRHEKSNRDGTGRLDLGMFANADILAAYNGDENCTANQTCFFPSVLKIDPGHAVTWTNADTEMIHILGDDMDSGVLYRGQSYSKTFSQDGTYAYHDSEHPWARGTVIVGTGTSLPEFVSSAITGPNQVTIKFSKPVAASLSDFGNLQITGQNFYRNITHITGSDTSEITATFDGMPVGTGATGTFHNILYSQNPSEDVADGQPAELESVSIRSVPVSGFAAPGDDIILEFEASEKIINVLTSINGNAASAVNTGANRWSASSTAGDFTSMVKFMITFEDAAGNKNTVSSTTDGSSIHPKQQNTLTGMVFADHNANGIWNVGEPGIGTVVSVLTMPPLQAAAGSSGAYRFSDPPHGIQTVYVTIPDGFEPSPGTAFYRNVQIDGRTVVDFALVPINTPVTGTLKVHVTSGNAPVDSALVRVETTLPRIGLTDGNGLYTFEDVLPGTYRILAVSGDHNPSSYVVEVTAGQTAQASIDLSPRKAPATGTISGTVKSILGDPIPSARITIMADPVQNVTADASGTFAFSGIRPGTYDVSVMAPNYMAASKTVTVIAGQSNLLELQMAPVPDMLGTSSITIISFYDQNDDQVRNTGERAIRDVQVTLFGPHRYTNGITYLTDTDGTVTFASLISETYYILAYHDGSLKSDKIDLGDGQAEIIGIGFK